MKKLYLIIFMIFFAIFQAQTVNITDTNFMTKLLSANSNTNQIAKNLAGTWTKIDLNNDGQIQVSEAINLSYLDLSSSPNTNYMSNLSGIESFINLVSLDLNRNNLTNINLSLPNLEKLVVNNNGVTSLDIQNCPKLKNLDISNHGFTALDIQSTSLKNIVVGVSSNPFSMTFQNLPNLETVMMFKAPIVSLDLSNKPTLKNVRLEEMDILTSLNLQGCNMLNEVQLTKLYALPSLNLQNLPELKKVYCTYGSNLQSINLTNSSSINTLQIFNNKLSSIDITTLNNLVDFNINNNMLTSLNVSNHNLLESLECGFNNINNLNLQNTPALKVLNCSSNMLQNLNLQSSPLLMSLNCTNNSLTTLDLSMLSNLNSLGCGGNNLQTLDITHNPLLTSINCSSNNLKFLFAKNGALQAHMCNFSSNNLLKYICCDPNQIDNFAYYVNYNGINSAVVINSYCSFTPGGSSYTIQGNTKYDSNGNGCDSNDLNKALQQFNITNGSVSATFIANNSGNHSIAVGAGTHTLTPVLENPAYWTISPSSLTVNFPSQTSPLTQNFCLTSNGTHNDLEVLIIPTTAAVPGFDTKYKIIYKNKGTVAQSGNVVFNFNDNLMNFLNATVSPDTQSTGTLIWNFTNLLPLQQKEITVTLKLNTPTQAPSLNGGDILHYTVQINGATDETPADNTFTLNQTVVNSFDPNDKTCLEGTTIAQTQVGDYVHYLIRFENTGTANAQNIVVKDEIDITKFDISSLVALNGSHNFVTRITNPNTVEFIFENIQLPFDDANNDGYVSFKIKTKSTLNIGNSFSNTAKIYFDYNHPIITNTYTTSVQNVLATAEIDKKNQSISVYPNPAKDVLNIRSKQEIIKAEIYDATGRIISSLSVTGNSISVSELSKGNYILKAFTKDKVIVQKFIKD
ncbi:DUF7619 domain-containing protein [Chryseobacterium cucumeris]|uniref:DUF7619 domain-containing protein n=1 Tax=Chryseobacterium cucumeris TaxID=1813611 RepID=UPI003D97ADB2